MVLLMHDNRKYKSAPSLLLLVYEQVWKADILFIIIIIIF